MYYIHKYTFIQFTAYGASLEELNVLRELVLKIFHEIIFKWVQY